MTATEPAFASVTSNDRRGLLWIASILSLILVLFTLSARLYVRKHMLGPDDIATVVAVAIAIGQYVTIFIGLSFGLGTSRPDVQRGHETMIIRVCQLLQAQMPKFCRLIRGNYRRFWRPKSSFFVLYTWPSLQYSWPQSGCSLWPW